MVGPHLNESSINEKRSPVRQIVIDTNVWLHCQFFRELRWSEWLQDDVEVILPPVLLRELDKKKVDGHSGRIRERAKKTLREIANMFQGSETSVSASKGLLYTVITREPTFSDGLDRDVPDDRFIATILNMPEPWPTFVSNDFGARIKAKSFGLTVLQPPEEWLLLDEPDEVQLLKRELEAMKAAAPRPILSFANFTNHMVSAVRSISEPEGIFLARKLDELRRKYPLDDEMSTARNYQSEQYNHALRGFYEKHESYLSTLSATENERELFIRVALCLSNEGLAPADDVDLILSIGSKKGVAVSSKPTKDSAPKPPPRHRTAYFPNLAHLPSPFLPAAPLEPPNISGPNIKSGGEVRYRIRRLKHGMRHMLPTFFVRFEKVEDVTGFQIAYVVHAANLRTHIEGQLNMSCEIQSLTFDEFLAHREATAAKKAAKRTS